MKPESGSIRPRHWRAPAARFPRQRPPPNHPTIHRSSGRDSTDCEPVRTASTSSWGRVRIPEHCLAQWYQSRGAVALSENAVVIGWKRGDEARSLAGRHALRSRKDILEKEWNAGEDAFRQLALRSVACALVILENEEIEFRIEPLAARDGLVDQFDRLDLFLSHQFGEAQPVIFRIVVDRHIPSLRRFS